MRVVCWWWIFSAVVCWKNKLFHNYFEIYFHRLKHLRLRLFFSILRMLLYCLLLCSISFFFLDLFIDWLLCWVFVSVLGLSLVVASGGHSSLRCAGLSLPWPLLLRSTGSRWAGSVVVAHGPSCSAACGIFPDQGLNLCPLH